MSSPFRSGFWLLTGVPRKTPPDYAAVHQQLQKPHVTLQLLWEEYREANPDGYRYKPGGVFVLMDGMLSGVNYFFRSATIISPGWQF
jgi:hypothetical protein